VPVCGGLVFSRPPRVAAQPAVRISRTTTAVVQRSRPRFFVHTRTGRRRSASRDAIAPVTDPAASVSASVADMPVGFSAIATRLGFAIRNQVASCGMPRSVRRLRVHRGGGGQSSA
jgi:hypothetical protein